MTSRRFTPPTGPRSGERDRQVRRVHHVTRWVAALAVLGTAVVGGLAAAGHGSSGSGSGSPAAQTAPPASTDNRIVQGRSQSQDRGSLQAPSSPPSSSSAPPVASSGGS